MKSFIAVLLAALAAAAPLAQPDLIPTTVDHLNKTLGNVQSLVTTTLTNPIGTVKEDVDAVLTDPIGAVIEDLDTLEKREAELLAATSSHVAATLNNAGTLVSSTLTDPEGTLKGDIDAVLTDPIGDVITDLDTLE